MIKKWGGEVKEVLAVVDEEEVESKKGHAFYLISSNFFLSVWFLLFRLSSIDIDCILYFCLSEVNSEEYPAFLFFL